MYAFSIIFVSFVVALLVVIYEHRKGPKDPSRKYFWSIVSIVCGLITALVTFQCPTVEIYPSDGVVSKDGVVTLATSAGFRIYYTLNAEDDPSKNGILYEGPIRVEKGTVLNAKSNFLPFWGSLNNWVLVVDELGGVKSIAPDAPPRGDDVLDIEVTYDGGDVKIGDMLTRDDFTVKAILADGTERVIDDFSFDDSNLSKPGIQLVKVTYESFEKSCEVSVLEPPKLEATLRNKDIEVGNTITNDMFDVCVSYPDGFKKEVNEFTVSPQEFSEPGDYKVTIKFEDMQTTCSISVKEAFVSEAWESHTPNDAATSVSMVAWNPDDDYGITGKRYSGGQKITVSNIFSAMGSSFEEAVESTYFIPVRNRDVEDVFEGIIVLDQSMLNSSSHGTISIEVDGKEQFTTGDIGAENQAEYPFSVPFKNVDTIRLITRATLIKSDFVYGFVNAD